MRPAKCHFGIDLFSTRFRFFFFSKEERRKHVHISCGDGEAKFWLEPAIELAENYFHPQNEWRFL